jgi:hypothetical protein
MEKRLRATPSRRSRLDVVERIAEIENFGIEAKIEYLP